MKMLEVLTQSLRICAATDADCDGCFYNQRKFGYTCKDRLLLAAAAALDARQEQLEQYNLYYHLTQDEDLQDRFQKMDQIEELGPELLVHACETLCRRGSDADCRGCPVRTLSDLIGGDEA